MFRSCLSDVLHQSGSRAESVPFKIWRYTAVKLKFEAKSADIIGNSINVCSGERIRCCKVRIADIREDKAYGHGHWEHVRVK